MSGWTVGALIEELKKWPPGRVVRLDGCGCCAGEDEGVFEYFEVIGTDVNGQLVRSGDGQLFIGRGPAAPW